MTNIIKNCPNEKFVDIFNQSNSISEIIKYFKLNINGAQYRAVRLKIKQLNLDTSRFDHSRWRRNAHEICKIPTEKILVENSTYENTVHLKNRLIKEKLLEYKCYLCNLIIWQNKYISLQIDHINGNRYDNRINNLRLLCPNCHSQCDTYAGKNKRKHTV